MHTTISYNVGRKEEKGTEKGRGEREREGGREGGMGREEGREGERGRESWKRKRLTPEAESKIFGHFLHKQTQLTNLYRDTMQKCVYIHVQ